MDDKLKKPNGIVVSERADIGIEGNLLWFKKISSSVPALQNKNYRLYFFGQLVSLTGTWLQIVAQGWLVLKLTNSAYYLGLIGALATIPSLALSVFGGVIVDRYSKRKILLFTQFGSMFLAFLLGLLTLLDIITVWEIGCIAFIMGIINAIDSPARQSFVPEIVTKDQLASAIALNSGIFNAARVIGPGMAGILIALIGTGGAFIVNAVSYIAVIAALFMMKLDIKLPGKYPAPLAAIREGIAFSFSHPVIRTLMLLIAVSSVFGWSYTTLLPLIAKNVFHVGAAGLGYLYASAGLGAVAATIVIAVSSKKFSPMFFIIGGNILFALSILAFSFISDIYIALLLLFFGGYGLISQFAMINTTIQRLVRNELRGRVMSIYSLMFMGMAPVGNYQIGVISENIGASFAIRIGALLVLASGFAVYFRRKKLRSAYSFYRRSII